MRGVGERTKRENFWCYIMAFLDLKNFHLSLCFWVTNIHWRQCALNGAGALQGGDGEFRGIFTPFYTINFRGGRKSGGARATVASPSLAQLLIYYYKYFDKKVVMPRKALNCMHHLSSNFFLEGFHFNRLISKLVSSPIIFAEKRSLARRGQQEGCYVSSNVQRRFRSAAKYT